MLVQWNLIVIYSDLMGFIVIQWDINAGWWFGTFFIFHFIYGIILLSDKYFSEGLKPPTSLSYNYVITLSGLITLIYVISAI